MTSSDDAISKTIQHIVSKLFFIDYPDVVVGGHDDHTVMVEAYGHRLNIVVTKRI